MAPHDFVAALKRHKRFLEGQLGGVRADLSDQTLSGLRLTDLDLRRAILKRTDFSGCTLAGADFRDSELKGADFRGAMVEAGKFDSADLRGSRFSTPTTLTTHSPRLLSGPVHLEFSRFVVSAVQMIGSSSFTWFSLSEPSAELG